MRRLRRPALLLLLAVVPLAFLVVFFLLPLFEIVGHNLTREAVGDVARSSSMQQVLWFTVWQAALSTAVTVLVSLPTAYLLGRYRFRGRNVIQAMLVVPFVMPTIVVGSAFVALFDAGGPLGFLHLETSVAAVIVAHVFFNFAVVARVVGAAWAQLPLDQSEAGAVLGASGWRAFRKITLPQLWPAIAASASIVFLFCFTSFGIVLLLAGPGRATVEVEIYRQTIEHLRLDVAAVLTTLQMVAVLLVLVLLGRGNRLATSAVRFDAPLRGIHRLRTRLFLLVDLIALALFLGGPLALVVERSLRSPQGYNLDAYRSLADAGRNTALTSALAALQRSLVYSLCAMVIALGIGVLASVVIAYGRGRSVRLFDAAMVMPLGVSAVTIGFGFLLALDDGVLEVRSSALLVPLAQTLVAVPFVIRATLPALRRIDPRLREASATLGASPASTLRRVDFPLARRSLLTAATFAFIVALGEFGATLFLVRPDSPTLPVLIFRLLNSPAPSDFATAMASSTVLMVITGMAALLIGAWPVRRRRSA